MAYIDSANIKGTLYELQDTQARTAIGYKEIELVSRSVYLTNSDPITPSTSTAFSSALVPCDPGDVFTISATGNNNAKPFCFVDNNMHIINIAVSSNVRGGVVTAPDGATQLAINNNNSTLKSYYGVNVNDSLTKLENAARHPVFNVGYIANATGVYNPGQPNGSAYSAVSALFGSDYAIRVKVNSHTARLFWYDKTSGAYVGNTGSWQSPPFDQTVTAEYMYRLAISFTGETALTDCIKFCKAPYNDVSIEEDHSLPPYKTVDLMIFMGQSNMAGRGVTSAEWPETAPALDTGAGFEFRAISDPTKLYPIAEPFGVAENKDGAIDDGNAKTGSMVTAFANAYYAMTGVPIVAVSASEGSTQIRSWAADSVRLSDAKQRFTDAVTYLTANQYVIRHKYVVWCQGETDGSRHTTVANYTTYFNEMLAGMKSVGCEKLFMCRIGEYNGSDTTVDYGYIIDLQTEMAQQNPDIVMVTTVLAGDKARGLMKDDYHYYQAAYNEMGTYSGINAAVYVNTGKEPTMYDPKSDDLYYTHKN